MLLTVVERTRGSGHQANGAPEAACGGYVGRSRANAAPAQRRRCTRCAPIEASCFIALALCADRRMGCLPIEAAAAASGTIQCVTRGCRSRLAESLAIVDGSRPSPPSPLWGRAHGRRAAGDRRHRFRRYRRMVRARLPSDGSSGSVAAALDARLADNACRVPGCRLSVVELRVSATSSESMTTAAPESVGWAIRSISWL